MPDSRAAPLLALAAAALLAGCSGNGAGADKDSAPADGPAGAGTLLGVVVDEAVRPLPGVFVVAQGPSGERNATTGPEGTFRLDGLAPGVYIVQASKEFYSTHQQAVDVSEAEGPPPLVQFQLAFQAQEVPYVSLYKFDGFFECGVWPTNGCANVNIVTGIMLCSLDLPCFNATGDRSVELIWIEAPPTYLQSEMVWEPTTASGESLQFGLGAATRQELQDGFADGYNFTEGRSPLLLALHGEVLEESRIGIDGRSLLIQVSTGVTVEVPGGCTDQVADRCGLGVSAEQPYTTYTHAFYGYTPPPGWRFTETGLAPPPPG